MTLIIIYFDSYTVCLGNICRSPIAEGVFQNLVVENGFEKVIFCDSAGTAAYHVGSLPDKRMMKVALDRGITLTHTARQLNYDDFNKYDYILAMDEANYDSIRQLSIISMGPNCPVDRLYLYRLFDPERGTSVNVPDPYYSNDSAFIEVFNIVTRSGQQFLKYIIEKHDLSAS